MTTSTRKTKPVTPFQASHHLARRLEELGLEPYQSKNTRYLVVMQDSPGELFDLGRPLKGSRFFSKNSIRNDRKTIADFEQWAAEDGLDHCYFWGIGTPCRKSTSKDFEDTIRAFNATINQEFSFLRTRFGFEVPLLTIHVRYDRFSDLIDLHAHFICRIADDHHIDEVKCHLRRKFSKYDFPLKPIQNPGACATYMHAGIFDNIQMLTWPDDVLIAVWKATENRFRFSRVGGSFAEWRSRKTAANDNPEARARKQLIKENRRVTADPRQIVFTGDKFLGKIRATVRGTKVFALLFESIASDLKPSNFQQNAAAPKDSSSATGGATQYGDNKAGKPLQRAVRWLTAQIATSRARLDQLCAISFRRLIGTSTVKDQPKPLWHHGSLQSLANLKMFLRQVIERIW